MNRFAVFAAVLIGMAGVAHAQPMNNSTSATPHHHWSQTSATMAQSCGNRVAITDEYGFRYDSQGDRLNAHGCVIAAPHTRPGAKVIKG
jgi:hypothetical protein